MLLRSNVSHCVRVLSEMLFSTYGLDPNPGKRAGSRQMLFEIRIVWYKDEESRCKIVLNCDF